MPLATMERELSRFEAALTDLSPDSRELAEALAERRIRRRLPLDRVVEAKRFLSEVRQNRNAIWRSVDGIAIGLTEAMATSDFPLLMGDILSRELLGRYQETPQTWRNYIQRRTTRDFRQNRLIAVDGLEGRLYPDYAKPELTEPQEGALQETGYLWSVDVYEKAVSLNWRQIINDDLDALTDIPMRFARAARRTEEYFAATLFVGASGPHSGLYSAGNGNIVTGNPELSIEAVEAALTQMSQFKDEDGEPIVITAVELVVPPALEFQANRIVTTREYRITDASGNVQIVSGNGLGRNFRVSVNHYIPIIADSNGNTSWFLFANPNEGRPAAIMGFLRGYEEPGLYRKAPNTQRVGGGTVAELGDFDNNEQRFKVMHILGGTQVDPKATIASNGSGS